MGEQMIVGVCTYRRPLMLADCLESLAIQSIPGDLSLSIVVVDNEAAPNNRQLVERFAAKGPLTVHYVHQPQRGIASARNSILDKAAELRVDWIAMLDDDETAAPDWIERLMAPEYRDTPVLWGSQVIVHSRPRPFWTLRRSSGPRDDDEGIEADLAHTNNVRFSTQLIEAGLRFNETLGMMGGEDAEFFARAHRLGFKIKRTTRAITYEEAHPERFTFSGRFYRVYWCAISDTRRQITLCGKRSMYKTCAFDVPAEFLEGSLTLLGSPLRLFKSAEKFKRRAISGSNKIAHALGVVAGMVGMLPRPYRETSGR